MSKTDMGWQMMGQNKFQIHKGGYIGVVNGRSLGCGYWCIMKDGEMIDECYRHRPISGTNIELATKAFVERRLAYIQSKQKTGG